jgi:hypothetical protein
MADAIEACGPMLSSTMVVTMAKATFCKTHPDVRKTNRSQSAA